MPIHTISPYHFLITGLVCQQWSLSVIHAQFGTKFCWNEGYIIGSLLYLPYHFLKLLSWFLSFNQSSFKAFLTIFPMGGWGVVLNKGLRFVVGAGSSTTWCQVTRHCCLHHCHPLQLVLVWCLPFWAPFLPFLPNFFLTSCFLERPSSDAFLFLSCWYCLPPFLFFHLSWTWLAVLNFLVCHTF